MTDTIMSTLDRIGDPTFCNKCRKPYMTKESTLKINNGKIEKITRKYICQEGHEVTIQDQFRKVCPAYHIIEEACPLCGQTDYDD